MTQRRSKLGKNKKARLGLCENISPKSPDEFPTEGYKDDLSDVPVVDYYVIYKKLYPFIKGLAVEVPFSVTFWTIHFHIDMKVYGPKCVRKWNYYHQALNKRI